MKKIILTVFLGIFLVSPTMSSLDLKTGSIMDDGWDITFGGMHSDTGECVFQTNDGGFLVLGNTQSYGSGGYDIWLIKTDETGNKIWDKIIGGKNFDTGRFAQQTSDNGFVIVGNTNSYGNVDREDVWLVKTDENGNEQWNKTYGGIYTDNAFSVDQTTDSGYVIIGQTWSWSNDHEIADAWLIRTDSNGNEIWNKTYGGDAGEGGFSGQQTNDLGFIMVGSTSSYADEHIDVWLVKTNGNGDELWNKTFSITENDVGWSVQQTEDNGYIITGFTAESTSIYGDVILIKTDESGKKQWIKTYGGDKGETGYFVSQTSDGGFIVTGQTYTYGSSKYDADLWLLKTDENGKLKWDRNYGGEQLDIGHCVRQTSDGGYIVAGETYSYGNGINDIWLIKFEEPEVSLDFTGGLGISNLILNVGKNDLTNLRWDIQLSKGFVFGGKEKIIDNILVNGSVKITKFVFGFGEVIIRITVGDVSLTKKGYLLGPFVILE